MDSVAWQATVLGITKRQTRLSACAHAFAHPRTRAHTHPPSDPPRAACPSLAAIPFPCSPSALLCFSSCSEPPASGPRPHIRGSIPMLNKWAWVSQVALVVKNQPDNAVDVRDRGSIPGWGRSPGGGHGNPLQCSCLENPRDRGAWWPTVHRVTQSWTRLNRLST